MLFSPFTLLLGLLDPFFQTQNVTAGVQRLLREEKPGLHWCFPAKSNRTTNTAIHETRHAASKKSATTKISGLPVDVLCVLWERWVSEARWCCRWCCRWQRRRGRRWAGSRWEMWREGRCPRSYHTQTQNCRGSGSGPGWPQPAPAQPATSTAHPAASGTSREKMRADLHRDSNNAATAALFFYLDVWAGGEPGLMSQHLVNVVEETQARGRGLQTVQPQRVPAHPQKLSWVEVDQVVTMVARRSLKVREKELRRRVGGRQRGERVEGARGPWWRCNGDTATGGGRPCAGCSAVCAGSSPSTEGERPSAGTWRPRCLCWAEPWWRAATRVPSQHSPSPVENRRMVKRINSVCHGRAQWLH